MSCSSKHRHLVTNDSKGLFFWHHRLGHIGFDHLTHVSGLDHIHGLSRLKGDGDLVCSSCRHGKMHAVTHPPLTMVMTNTPRQLLHFETFGPSCVQSSEGTINYNKLYVIVVVDDYSRYFFGFLWHLR